MLRFAKAAMAWNITRFVEAGWNPCASEGGVGCDKDFLGLPSLDDRECLVFLYGFVLTRGVPKSGGYPSMPPSIAAEYIQAAEELDYESPWLTVLGETPHYPRASITFGISSPEQFALVGPSLDPDCRWGRYRLASLQGQHWITFGHIFFGFPIQIVALRDITGPCRWFGTGTQP